MKKLIVPITIVACLYGASAAYAVENGDVNRHVGPFIEANYGTNLYYEGLLSSYGSFKSEGFTGHGWFASAGYYFTPIWAVEAGFMQNYAQYKFTDDVTGYSHTNIPYVAARISAPIGSRLSFNVKLGVMYASAAFSDSNDDSIGTPSLALPLIGVGLAVAMTHHLDFTINYQGAVYGIAGAGLLGAGLAYHF